MSNLAPWLLLLLGFLLGFVLEWLVDLWFWRRKWIANQKEIEVLRNKVQAQTAELAAAEAHIDALKAELEELSKEMVAAQPAAITEDAKESSPAEIPDIVLTAPDLSPSELSEIDLADPELPPPEISDIDPTDPEIIPSEISEIDLANPELTSPELEEIDLADPELNPSELAEIDISEPELSLPQVPDIVLTSPDPAPPALPHIIQPQLPAIDDIPPEADLEVSIPELPSSDDLTRIKGIGAKFAAILNEAGINSFAQLAARTPEELHAIVDPPAWRKVDTTTWIEQAQILAVAPPPEANDNDLTLIDGIGATFAARLYEAGIDSFAALATSDEDTLAQVIKAPEWRRPDFASWIDQAQARLVS